MSDGRRESLVALIADHILDHGLAASSIRPLAAAAGVSDRMLLYYFRDKADVVATALDALGTRLELLLSANRAAQTMPPDTLRPRLVAALLDDALWPYMRLWLEIASRAAGGDAFHRQVGHGIVLRFLDWVADQLDAPTVEQRAEVALNLMTFVEGCVVMKAVGIEPKA